MWRFLVNANIKLPRLFNVRIIWRYGLSYSRLYFWISVKYKARLVSQLFATQTLGADNRFSVFLWVTETFSQYIIRSVAFNCTLTQNKQTVTVKHHVHYNLACSIIIFGNQPHKIIIIIQNFKKGGGTWEVREWDGRKASRWVMGK